MISGKSKKKIQIKKNLLRLLQVKQTNLELIVNIPLLTIFLCIANLTNGSIVNSRIEKFPLATTITRNEEKQKCCEDIYF